MRLFAMAAAIAAGAAAAERLAPTWAVALAVAALALTALVAAPRAGLAVVVAAAAFGFGLAGARIAVARDGPLAAAAEAGADAVLDGRVLGEVRARAGSVSFTVTVARAEIDGDPLRVRGRVRVTASEVPRGVVPGSAVRVDARLRPLRSARVAGLERLLLRRGIAARASARAVRLLGPPSGPLDRVAAAGRRAVVRASAFVPERERGLLRSVTIGDTSSLDARDEVSFRRSGLSHLLAVSGANVAIVLGAVAVLLRLLGAGRRVGVGVLGVVLLGFMAVTGFEPSVMRAGTMAAVALGGVLAGARAASLHALGIATLLLVARDPFIGFSAGFQLSVLATVGLVVLAPRIAERFPSGRLSAATSVSMGAQLAVTPLLVARFGEISPASLAANLLAAPAVGVATVAGMAAAAAGAVWAPLGALAAAAAPPLWWMRVVAGSMAALPLASIPLTGVAAVAVTVAGACLAVAAARAGRPAGAATVAIAVTALLASATWTRAVATEPVRGMVVTMLDVGQGDAIVVRAPGATVLVDGGGDPAVLARALAAEGVARIDLLVLTHPHADHVDGLVAVAGTMPVGRALDPALSGGTSAYDDIVRSLRRRGIPRDVAVAGAAYDVGGLRVDVLWPPKQRLEGTASDLNNNSIVLRARYGADAILLAGELQEEAQEELLALGEARLRASVLKVAHHGSARMVPAFYRATRARAALIPVGPNMFGHPAAVTLAALQGMEVLRSDLHGVVRVSLDGRGGRAVRTQRRDAA